MDTKTNRLVKNLVLLVNFLLLFTFYQCDKSEVSGISTKCQNLALYQGEKTEINFMINNRELYDLKTADNFFVSYHIYDENKKLLMYDNRRFFLAVGVKKKSKVKMNIPLFFSYKPGNYLVEFDVVKEGKFWGGKTGWKTVFINLKIKDLFSPDFRDKYLKNYLYTPYEPVNKEQYLLRLILKNSEIYKNGRLWGFSAGSGYPQIWIRDTATIIRYASLHYPLNDLQKMLEIFLVCQEKNGEIVDWVDANDRRDKNTVETDQESSLVIAAGELALKDRKWLAKTIAGHTIKKRLIKALAWVWNNKRNQEFNLIYSGFTADWGDVEKSYPDQRATKLSDRSRLVFSIYTQAMYIRAIKTILPFVHQSERRIWEERLNILKKQTRRILYLKDKGYFIVHLDPLNNEYLKLEAGILPLGGNAEAIKAGLMNKKEMDRFIRVLERRRKKYNLRTISFTLIPPYPRGFFPHPALWNEWSYQNGGEWDWIGGRYVSALFLHGYKREAHRYILEIIRKHLTNYTIFEWEDKNGNGRGSFSYVGAAGVIGEAILNGYSGDKNPVETKDL